MAERNEVTGREIAALASKGLTNPASLTAQEIRRICASALSQAPDREEPEPLPADVPPDP